MCGDKPTPQSTPNPIVSNGREQTKEMERRKHADNFSQTGRATAISVTGN